VVRVARRGTRFMASEFAAVHSLLDIMSENDRIVMEFDSSEFGTVLQVRTSCVQLLHRNK
jgi:phosphatidylserine decarboxylase